MNSSFNEDEFKAGRKLFSAPARFMLGVSSLDALPPETRPEVAFAGRSNVGKSTLINALTGVTGLARASNTPGRTRELNFFDVGGRLTLVDMPGYGFAKASKKDVKQWQTMLRGYLRMRAGLKRAFVLIDARHGVMAADIDMLGMLDEAAVAYQLVLTKTDKIKPSTLGALIDRTREVVAKRAAALPSIHVTSAEKRTGIAELGAEIARLLP